jgi:hypothetical protein
MGDYTGAVAWLKKAPEQLRTGCGACNECERALMHPALTVWNVAALPNGKAVPQLEAIKAGRFTPLKLRDGNRPDEEEEARLARDEAFLVLGELHARNGETALALKPLAVVSRRSDQLRSSPRRSSAGSNARFWARLVAEPTCSRYSATVRRSSTLHVLPSRRSATAILLRPSLSPTAKTCSAHHR